MCVACALPSLLALVRPSSPPSRALHARLHPQRSSTTAHSSSSELVHQRSGFSPLCPRSSPFLPICPSLFLFPSFSRSRRSPHAELSTFASCPAPSSASSKLVRHRPSFSPRLPALLSALSRPPSPSPSFSSSLSLRPSPRSRPLFHRARRSRAPVEDVGHGVHLLLGLEHGVGRRLLLLQLLVDAHGGREREERERRERRERDEGRLERTDEECEERERKREAGREKKTKRKREIKRRERPEGKEGRGKALALRNGQ